VGANFACYHLIGKPNHASPGFASVRMSLVQHGGRGQHVRAAWKLETLSWKLKCIQLPPCWWCGHQASGGADVQMVVSTTYQQQSCRSYAGGEDTKPAAELPGSWQLKAGS